ncbi:MAG: hypothetical protein IKB34_07880 [Clostridia bacterium]|nr:hypothetical protein [Clostridia bacterium]
MNNQNESTLQAYTAEHCAELLRAKYRELTEQGERRFPKRSDFTEREVIAIKARLGPWPRALELAGIKEGDGGQRESQRMEKRKRAKRRRTEEKKASGIDGS